jgi:NADPH-dependent 2,4-dienoyl-CoA reductase/sulfur reductase-like enzyme
MIDTLDHLPKVAVLGAGLVAGYWLLTHRRSKDSVAVLPPRDLHPIDSNQGLEVSRTNSPRHFLVVGGGPSGALMACYLAKMGHRITVLERDSKMTIDSALDKSPPAAEATTEGLPSRTTGVTLYPRGKRALQV